MNSEMLNIFTPPVIYVILSGVVAILIGIEGQMLKKTKGKLPKSAFFYFSSTLDTLWFFASIVAIYLVDFPKLALTVPVGYILYTITGWVYGSRLLKKNGYPKRPNKLIIPMPYIAFSQSFALVYFLLCIFILTTFM